MTQFTTTKATSHSTLVTDLSDLGASSECFYEEDYLPVLEKMVNRVIEFESPIHQDILCKRIARHHGFKRTGNQIKERVCSIAESFFTTEEDVGVFYWYDSDMNTPARAFGRDAEMIKVENISREEINAIMTAVGDTGDLAEFSRAIGIGRITQQVRDRLAKTIKI